MDYLYLIIIFILLFIISQCYIKIKYKFWSRQPVFHYYNLLFWLYPKGIIDKSIPKINKYCDFINIETKQFIDCDNNILGEIVNFIKTYYITNSSCYYAPSITNFSSYFFGSTEKTFITMYYKPNLLLNNDNTFIKDKELIGVMTSRPIYIIINSNIPLLAYYVDNLCIHNQYRKQNIAPKIIQTTNYTQRLENKNSQISIFKREGEITGIVPLTKYNTYQFNIKSIYSKNSSISNDSLDFIHKGLQILEVNKLNINKLIDFIYNNNSFETIIIPDISQLITLVNNKTYIIYCVLENSHFKAIYFFKDSQMKYKLHGERENRHNNNNNNNNNNNIKSIDLFASINILHDDNLFIELFKLILNKCNKNNVFDLITIENISHNNSIINYLFMLKLLPVIVSPTAYFYYNYAKKPILPEKALIIC